MYTFCICYLQIQSNFPRRVLSSLKANECVFLLGFANSLSVVLCNMHANQCCESVPLLHSLIKLWRICHLMAENQHPSGIFICIYPIMKEAEHHPLYPGTFVYLTLRKHFSGLLPIVLNLCVCMWSFIPRFSRALQALGDCVFISNICYKYFPFSLPLPLFTVFSFG